LPVPIGISELYDSNELFDKLAFLIMNNLKVKKWIFKIDNEINSNGIAYLKLKNWK
jgi:hypothetical protein